MSRDVLLSLSLMLWIDSSGTNDDAKPSNTSLALSNDDDDLSKFYCGLFLLDGGTKSNTHATSSLPLLLLFDDDDHDDNVDVDVDMVWIVLIFRFVVC